MTVSMYKISVPIFVQFLTSLSAVLDKAAAFAEAKKVDPSVLLNTRLTPDMFPLVRQVRAATDHAISAGGRLAGVDLPTIANDEATIPALKERIAKAIDFLKGLTAAQIDGTEGRSPSRAARPASSPGSRCCSTTRCRTSISTAPRPTTSCATAASSSASATSWARRCRCNYVTRSHVNSWCCMMPANSRRGGLSAMRPSSKRTCRTCSPPTRLASEEASTLVTSVRPSKV
jgi:Domain of unknown function (DUF1993)